MQIHSLEFISACEDLCWNPHRPETHRIAENAVRRAKEGTSALLVHSGLSEKLWGEAMERFCYLQTL